MFLAPSFRTLALFSHLRAGVTYCMYVCRCGRLGLVSLAYLWQRDQEELLKEMIDCGLEAIIIKVAAMGKTEQTNPPVCVVCSWTSQRIHGHRRVLNGWGRGFFSQCNFIPVCNQYQMLSSIS